MKEHPGGRKGSTAVEYALIVGILVLAIIIGVTEVGQLVGAAYGGDMAVD